MYPFAVDELVWALAREREEEARQTRPHTETHPRPSQPLRSRLAHHLARAAACLDPAAGRSRAGDMDSGYC